MAIGRCVVAFKNLNILKKDRSRLSSISPPDIFLIRRIRDCRQNADNDHCYHQFDQGKSAHPAKLDFSIHELPHFSSIQISVIVLAAERLLPGLRGAQMKCTTWPGCSDVAPDTRLPPFRTISLPGEYPYTTSLLPIRFIAKTMLLPIPLSSSHAPSLSSDAAACACSPATAFPVSKKKLIAKLNAIFRTIICIAPVLYSDLFTGRFPAN